MSSVEPRYAGLIRRVGAQLIDLFILQVALFIVLIPLIVRGLTPLFTPRYGTDSLLYAELASYSFGLAALMLYFVLPEWRWGRTPGKWFMRIRVVDSGGDRIGLPASVARNLMMIVDGLPMFYLLGGVAVIVSKTKQRLGDRVARTFVVRDAEQTPLPSLARTLASWFCGSRHEPIEHHEDAPKPDTRGKGRRRRAKKSAKLNG